MSAATYEHRPVEARAEVEALETLHGEKMALMDEYRTLKVLHGPFGRWDSRRRALRAAFRLKARIECASTNVKATEAYLDDLAEGSDAYLALIDEGIAAAVRFTELARRRAKQQANQEKVSA